MITATLQVIMAMISAKIVKFFAKAIAIAFVVVLITTGGITWKNHVIEIDGNNEMVRASAEAMNQGTSYLKESIDSMEAAAKDTVAGKIRMGQIRSIMIKIEAFGKYVKSKRDIFECTPYLSELTANSRAERKKFIASIDTMKVHYMSNTASYYKRHGYSNKMQR